MQGVDTRQWYGLFKGTPAGRPRHVGTVARHTGPMVRRELVAALHLDDVPRPERALDADSGDSGPTRGDQAPVEACAVRSSRARTRGLSAMSRRLRRPSIPSPSSPNDT